jgi:hypothetical protein
MPTTQRTPAGVFFSQQFFDSGLAAQWGHSASSAASHADFSLQDDVAGFCFVQHVGWAETDGSGVGSASEQQDFFLADGAGWERRDSTRGRTCSGGSTPFASAQASFSSREKQQQSPFQHCSEVRHPHGRDWHGYGTPSVGFLWLGAGNGNPNVSIR